MRKCGRTSYDDSTDKLLQNTISKAIQYMRTKIAASQATRGKKAISDESGDDNQDDDWEESENEAEKDQDYVIPSKLRRKELNQESDNEDSAHDKARKGADIPYFRGGKTKPIEDVFQQKRKSVFTTSTPVTSPAISSHISSESGFVESLDMSPKVIVERIEHPSSMSALLSLPNEKNVSEDAHEKEDPFRVEKKKGLDDSLDRDPLADSSGDESFEDAEQNDESFVEPQIANDASKKKPDNCEKDQELKDTDRAIVYNEGSTTDINSEINLDIGAKSPDGHDLKEDDIHNTSLDTSIGPPASVSEHSVDKVVSSNRDDSEILTQRYDPSSFINDKGESETKEPSEEDKKMLEVLTAKYGDKVMMMFEKKFK